VTKRASNTPGFACGSVRADEILTVREAARRLGWARDTITKMQRAGLRSVRPGKFALTTGRDILDLYERLARPPAAHRPEAAQ